MCVTGIDDVERRLSINKQVTAEGGEYVKNLERPVRVTHLLCTSGPDELTDKMKYAQKFNKAGEADIELLWEEWFWDCLTVGGIVVICPHNELTFMLFDEGRLDEESYRIIHPRRPPISLAPGI